MLVTSNFSFSYSVFKRLVLQTHKNQGLFGKGLKDSNNFFLVIQLYLPLITGVATLDFFFLLTGGAAVLVSPGLRRKLYWAVFDPDSLVDGSSSAASVLATGHESNQVNQGLAYRATDMREQPIFK